MTDIINIPLNRLTLWKGNVRKTGAAEGIDELAASIDAHGLLQSLVVRKAKRGKYEILAGQRRYLALKSLVEDGKIATNYAVPCKPYNDNVDASELSLAENVVRAPMHPADQFEAFRALVDGGSTVTDIAARFGITETAVAKRLRLGRLSPTILDAYRNGEIGLEQAQAFAVTDDREAQERVFTDLPDWNRDPDAIRRALTAQEIPTTDKRILFVGVDAYQAAGGAIRQDLFCEDGTGYVLDAELLDRMVSAKLATVAAEVSAEGWRWVETVADLDYQALSRFARRYPEQVDLPEDDQAELDRLSEEYDALAETDAEDDADRLPAIEQRIDQLTSMAQAWPAETLALAGAIVSLDRDGGVDVDRGLVRKDDLRNVTSDGQISTGDEEEATAVRPAFSPKLVEDLTAQKSAAIGAALASQPDIALAAVVHCLALSHFYPGCRADSCLEFFIGSYSMRSSLTAPDACKGFTAIEHERDRLGDRLPGSPADLWPWCLERTRDELLDVLAVIAAKTVNAVLRRTDRPDASGLKHAGQLAEALKLDMTAWFTPTAENYFGRINRSQILAAIDEAKGDHAPALEKLKKAELAARAETLIADTGWLPEPVRIVSAEDEALAVAA